MDFAFTEDQRNIREAVLNHCHQFPDDYWLDRDRDAVFPQISTSEEDRIGEEGQGFRMC